MDPNLKIALILIAFVIISYWILNSYYQDPKISTEHYSAAFDPKFIDPRVGSASYSKNIAFRPDENEMSIDSIDKVFDHVDDQELGVSQSQYDVNQNNGRFKQVRFAVPVSEQEPASLPFVRDVNHYTSYQETDINVDRVNESNNIHNYCIHGNDRKTSSCCGGNVDNIYNIDPEFVDRVKGTLSMDMSDDQYAAMMNPKKAKTYIQVQEDETLGAGEYDDIGSSPVQDIVGLQEITDVINLYRNNSLNSIRGSYQDINTIPRNKGQSSKSMIYDSLN